MTPDRRARFEALYRAARARPAAEWPAFLREACPDDGALRDEVAARLAHDPPSDAVTAAPPAARLSPGAILSHYRIEARLGAGGMGEVFRAVDSRLDRQVAIKVPSTAFSPRFRREAQALAALNHPHICTVFDVGADYLVMELVEGETAADRLLRGPLPLSDVLRLGTQVASALAAAHAKGITHRDLKPANVMLTPGGVKLLDFGLASRGDHSLTQTGAVMGTPAYMAPEQVQGRDAGPQTDIYALGLILYELATGSRPAIHSGEPADLDALPDTLAHVVARCLAEDPGARWRTASEAGALLEWFARSRETGPRTARPSEEMSSEPRGRRALAPLAVAVVLAASAGWMARTLREPVLDSTPAAQGPESTDIAAPAGGRFVTDDINHGGVRISPNGRWIAYVALVGGQMLLWARPLDPREGPPRSFRGTNQATRPFWSPDSRWIAFGAEGSLRKVDVESGVVETLWSTGTSSSFTGGAWLDDRIVFGGWNRGLSQIPIAGGEATPLTEPADGEVHSRPLWLGGDRLLYQVQGGSAAGIYAISVAEPKAPTLIPDAPSILYAYASGHLFSYRGEATGEATIVAQAFDPVAVRFDGEAHTVGTQAARLAWASVSNNGRLVYNASSAVRPLRWLDASGNPDALVQDSTMLVNPDVSPSGAAAAVGQNAVWLIDENGLPVPLASAGDRSSFSSPVLAADGRSLIVSGPAATPGDRPRASNLFRVSTGRGRSELERVTESPNGQFASDWSPAAVLYTQRNVEAGGADLWWLQVNPDGTLGPATLYLPRAVWGAFSPGSDPRWVAYQQVVSGQAEIFVNSFPTPGRPVRISASGGAYPRWGERGIYYASPDGMMLAPVTVAGNEIEATPPRRLFLLPTGAWDGGNTAPFFDVAPDGRFLISLPERSEQVLRTIADWRALLTP